MNQKLAKSDKYELVHFFKTSEYSTQSGNRTSIATIVIQALRIVETGKLGNQIQLKEITTDLIRNYKPTKSTKETHQKKIKKLRLEYPDAEEMLA
jgi:hypothetical protein